jgi:hypothetical protein
VAAVPVKVRRRLQGDPGLQDRARQAARVRASVAVVAVVAVAPPRPDSMAVGRQAATGAQVEPQQSLGEQRHSRAAVVVLAIS